MLLPHLTALQQSFAEASAAPAGLVTDADMGKPSKAVYAYCIIIYIQWHSDACTERQQRFVSSTSYFKDAYKTADKWSF